MQSTTPALPARVWDRFVRFFHWSLVSCVLANYFLVDDGETLHQWIGYFASGLTLDNLQQAPGVAFDQRDDMHISYMREHFALQPGGTAMGEGTSPRSSTRSGAVPASIRGIAAIRRWV